ncbi:ATPase [Mycoplasma mycoides subsp. mycoides]|nr:ATPase [Mycoplasma mycoides subsp. mycoides]TNJ32619.1 ATPase [Mycoplasma mycoides subsp. mycoides]
MWDSQKKEQETRSLNNVNDSFKKIVVVYEDIIPWHDNNGIYYVGLKEFLLDESILNN